MRALRSRFQFSLFNRSHLKEPENIGHHDGHSGESGSDDSGDRLDLPVLVGAGVSALRIRINLKENGKKKSSYTCVRT